MCEIFVHDQLALYISIALTILFLVGVGILSADDGDDFWDNLGPAIVLGLLIFFLWQPILLLVGACCVITIPVYIGYLIGKVITKMPKKKEEPGILKKNSEMLKENPNFK
jgi:hypothetical protein